MSEHVRRVLEDKANEHDAKAVEHQAHIEDLQDQLFMAQKRKAWCIQAAHECREGSAFLATMPQKPGNLVEITSGAEGPRLVRA